MPITKLERNNYNTNYITKHTQTPPEENTNYITKHTNTTRKKLTKNLIYDKFSHNLAK
jgi:hypothetical protein